MPVLIIVMAFTTTWLDGWMIGGAIALGSVLVVIGWCVLALSSALRSQ